MTPLLALLCRPTVRRTLAAATLATGATLTAAGWVPHAAPERPTARSAPRPAAARSQPALVCRWAPIWPYGPWELPPLRADLLDGPLAAAWTPGAAPLVRALPVTQPVPEPAGVALLAVGVVGLVAVGRRG